MTLNNPLGGNQVQSASLKAHPREKADRKKNGTEREKSLSVKSLIEKLHDQNHSRKILKETNEIKNVKKCSRL